jgi:hypothetical protein
MYCQNQIPQAISSGALYPYPGQLIGGKYACAACAEKLITAAKQIKYPINGHCPTCGAPVYEPAEAHAFRVSYCSGDGYYGCNCRLRPQVYHVELKPEQMDE